MLVRNLSLTIIAVLFGLMPVVGCSSSGVTKTWRDPDLKSPVAFNKIVVLVDDPDESVRRPAEDELVRQLGSDRAVAGYSLVSNADRNDSEQLKSKLADAGVDGSLVVQITTTRDEQPEINGTGGVDDRYDRAGLISPDRNVASGDVLMTVHASLYSGADGKLLWSGTSETTNRASVRQVIREAAKSIATELRKGNVIQ